MRMMNLLTTSSQKIKKKIREKKLSECSAFLFGSVLNSNKVNDIDALIIYKHKDLDIALDIRSELRTEFSKEGLKLDMLLLSEKEYQESKETINWKMQKLSLTSIGEDSSEK